MDEPLLPGSEEPVDGYLPLAYIYQPTPSAMQSALARRPAKTWVLDFEPWDRREIEPLMGWTSTRDPLNSFYQLHFPDVQSALDYAKRQGWKCIVQPPPIKV